MKKNSRIRSGQDAPVHAASLREKMVDNLELPKDLMLGAAILTVTGRKEALISNYKGILK